MDEIIKHYDAIAVAGKPGSGKGTQSRKMKDATGFDYFSSGDRFRELASEDSVIGNRVGDIIDNGKLMPYWFASFVFQEKALTTSDDSGIIFDGVARKKPEAELFDEVMKWLGRRYVVVYLDISDDLVVERTAMRRSTQDRADDAEKAVRERINQYDKEVKPAIDFFREQGTLVEIDGEQPMEKVSEDIKNKLQERIL